MLIISLNESDFVRGKQFEYRCLMGYSRICGCSSGLEYQFQNFLE